MHIFYEPDILKNGGLLNEEESKHCVRVLRHKSGDTIHVIDGKGTRALCTITDASPRACQVKIEQTETLNPVLNKTHIAIAPTKSIDRFEWFLEKSTELGINEITPLLCRQSERKQIKPHRLEKIITAATKQSMRLWRPVMNEMTKLEDFLKTEHRENLKYIAHCVEENRKELIQELKQANTNKDVLILIGPEGDFSDAEIEMALQNGFKPVSLGKNRLRTETAGIAACMIAEMTMTGH